MAVAPDIDFLADPEVVRIVVEGHRLGYGHLANPGFGAEVSLIDPLPHQRLAVYGPMLSERPLRFLLADDAGAGKTIMTGLYIREMLSRRLLRRILIIRKPCVGPGIPCRSSPQAGRVLGDCFGCGSG